MVKLKKETKMIQFLVLVMMLMLVLAGCGNSSPKNETAPSSEGSSKPADSANVKMAWYAPAPHPFMEEVQKGVAAFEKEFGITVQKQIGPDWNQAIETDNVEALAAKGYNYISIFPMDPSGANGLYEGLTKKGAKIISYGANTLKPTTSSAYIGSDVKAAAKEATEALIGMMNGKGNIINILEVLSDPNTVLRKEGVEEVVAKYPDVKIIQEVGDMKTVEQANEKIQNAIAANITKVDGVIATGGTPSIAIAQVMEEYMKKNANGHRIFSIGIDTDPIVIKAIGNGFMDATISQNPLGMGYLSMLYLKYLSEGWTPVADTHEINAGTVLITKANLATYPEEIANKTAAIKKDLETKYLQKK